MCGKFDSDFNQNGGFFVKTWHSFSENFGFRYWHYLEFKAFGSSFKNLNRLIAVYFITSGTGNDLINYSLMVS